MGKCIYQGCRLEAKPGSPYCKYHVRMTEIEDKYPQWLKDMIRKMRDENKSGAGAKCVNATTAPGEHLVKIKGD